MEGVAVLTCLCVLAVLATRWGVDSADSLRSKEEELAGLGVTWGPTAPSGMRSRGRARSAPDPRRTRRGQLAHLLRVVADGIDPKPAPTTRVRNALGLLAGTAERCDQCLG